MKGRSDDNVNPDLLALYRDTQHRLGAARRRVLDATTPEQREREQADHDMLWVRLGDLRQQIEAAR